MFKYFITHSFFTNATNILKSCKKGYIYTTFSVIFCSRWVCLLNGIMLKSCPFCLQKISSVFTGKKKHSRKFRKCLIFRWRDPGCFSRLRLLLILDAFRIVLKKPGWQSGVAFCFRLFTCISLWNPKDCSCFARFCRQPPILMEAGFQRTGACLHPASRGSPSGLRLWWGS